MNSHISLLLVNRLYNSGLTYILAIKFGVEHQCVKQVSPRYEALHELVRKHLQTVYWLISY